MASTLIGRIALTLSASLLAGCLDAEDYLFDAKKTSSYELPGNTIPEDLIEAIEFDSGGNTLYGFWVKPTPATDDPANAVPPKTLLYFHGNKHNIDTFWSDVMRLRQTGAEVVIFDYRGFGRSEGESGSLDAFQADARAALRFVEGRGVAPSDLCLYGYSLGNVGAIYLASRGTTYRCLIVQSAFASAAALLQGASFLPIPEAWVTDQSFNNADAIDDGTSPVLVLHGSRDGTTRFEDHGKILFDQAPDPKKLVVVSGAGHTDLPETMGDEAYVAEIGSFLAQSPP